MRTIVGREREFDQAWEGIRKAQQHRASTVVRIAGISGIGKTVLLERVLDSASSNGWFVVRTDCHRIQAGTPMAVVQRTLKGCFAKLGGAHERDPASMPADALLLRQLEAILADRPVLLAIDDAQWADAESRESFQFIVQSLSGQSLCFVTTERSDDTHFGAFHYVNAEVLLDRLHERDAAALVTSIYPAAPENIVRAIVERSAGHPLNLQALAESALEQEIGTTEALSFGLDTLLASYLRTLPASLREFLQICSLIAEPIEDQLLAQIWPNALLQDLIGPGTARYMFSSGDGLRFVHAAVAEGIRRTIPLDIPYRRRIINALQRLAPSLENLERISEQAGACHDKDLQRSTLLQLAAEASRSGSLNTAANAYRRALALGEPAKDQLIDIYRQYVTTLSALSLSAEARAVAERALTQAETAGLEGLGSLAALLIMNTCVVENSTAALETYTSLLPRFRTSHDLAELHTAALYVHSAKVNVSEFEATAANLHSLDTELTGIQRARTQLFEAFLRLRSGDVTQSRRRLERAAHAAESAGSILPTVIAQATTIINFLEFGPRKTEDELNAFLGRFSQGIRTVATFDYLIALTYFSSGRWDDARAFLNDAIIQRCDKADRRRILSLDIAMAALLDQPSARYALAAHECSRIDENTHPSFVPLAIWYAALCAESGREDAAELTWRTAALLRRPLDPLTMPLPYGLVVAAERLGSRDLLLQLTDSKSYFPDDAPWTRAQREFAVASAQHALGDRQGRESLLRVGQQLDDFGAPLLAAIARKRIAATNAADDLLLACCGLDSTEKSSESPLSRREGEVVRLVAEGRTNREIANELTLSERTIEAHLTNAFKKTGASSRAQLVRIFMESKNSVARRR